MKKKILIERGRPIIAVAGNQIVQTFEHDVADDASGDNVFEMESYETESGTAWRLASDDPAEIARFEKWNGD